MSNIDDIFKKQKEQQDEKILLSNFSALCMECWWPTDVFFLPAKKKLLYVCENGHTFEVDTEVNWIG